MLKIKPGAIPSNRLEMVKVRKAVVQAFAEMNAIAWLTSGMDGDHYEGTFHYAGFAEDYDGVRPNFLEFTKEEWAKIGDRIEELIDDPLYQVIQYRDHIHIEYDPPEFDKYK